MTDRANIYRNLLLLTEPDAHGQLLCFRHRDISIPKTRRWGNFCVPKQLPRFNMLNFSNSLWNTKISVSESAKRAKLSQTQYSLMALFQNSFFLFDRKLYFEEKYRLHDIFELTRTIHFKKKPHQAAMKAKQLVSWSFLCRDR